MTLQGAPGAAAPRAGLASRVEWRPWLGPAALVALVLLTGFLYWPSTASLLHEWFEVPSSAYRHGSLIVAIALWLLARKAHAAAPVARETVLPGWPLLLLAGAGLVWLIGFRAGIQVAHQAMLPVIVWLTVCCVFGTRIAARSLVPVGLMYSAVPIWHVTVPALQSMTIAVVSALLRVVGIPAYVAGDFVHIRSGVFHVEDGCAGLHYFIVAATIAVLFGELRDDRLRTRVYLFGLAVGLALVSNWLRVFIIIVAGDLTNMQHYLVRVDHSTFGWVVFGFAMVAFLLLGRMKFLNAPGPDVTPVVESMGARGAAPRSAWQRYALAAVAAGLAPAWLLLAPVRNAAGPNVSVPASVAGWSGPAEPCHGRWRPRFETADLRVKQEFSRAGARVCFYSATYLSQHQDKELIGYFSSIYDPDIDVISAGARQVAGRSVNELQLGNETAGDRIVWYAYAVGDREMRRGVAAQLGYALGSLHGAPAASVYAVSALCVPDCAAARQLLTDFLPHVTVSESTRERVK